MNWIQQNLLTIIWSIVTLVVGVFFSWFFTIRYRNIKKVMCLTESENVVKINNRNNLNALKISYNGEIITTLNMTAIVFWNSGNTDIRQKDISKKDPIRVEIELDDKIYDYGVNKVSRDSCDFKLDLSEDRRTLFITFDFIWKKDGINIYILHSSLKRIKLSGTIIGAEGKLHPRFTDRIIKKSFDKKVSNVFGLFFSIFFCAIFGLFFFTSLSTNLPVLTKLVFGISFLFLGFLCFIVNYTSKNIPRNLRMKK
jgi:hypothetical protein